MRFLSVLAALIVFGSPLLAAPPNVVVILSDDVGYGDLGCYGAKLVKVSTSSGEWYGEALRSKIRGVSPRSIRRSTTWEPMKPPPPVTRTLMHPP